jgi:hypothetical protein
MIHLKIISKQEIVGIINGSAHITIKVLTGRGPAVDPCETPGFVT